MNLIIASIALAFGLAYTVTTLLMIVCVFLGRRDVSSSVLTARVLLSCAFWAMFYYYTHST